MKNHFDSDVLVRTNLNPNRISHIHNFPPTQTVQDAEITLEELVKRHAGDLSRFERPHFYQDEEINYLELDLAEMQAIRLQNESQIKRAEADLLELQATLAERRKLATEQQIARQKAMDKLIKADEEAAKQ